MNVTNLEQSRLLKEWGAPQDTTFRWFQWDGRERLVTVSENSYFEDNGGISLQICAANSIEELIEWLGDDFKSLQRHEGYANAFGYQWTVNGGKKIFETSLEAVFNLCEAVKGDNNLTEGESNG